MASSLSADLWDFTIVWFIKLETMNLKFFFHFIENSATQNIFLFFFAFCTYNNFGILMENSNSKSCKFIVFCGLDSYLEKQGECCRSTIVFEFLISSIHF